MRPDLREILSNNGFRIIAIPGNHDLHAFQGNLDFGSDLEIITSRPFGTFQVQNLLLIGVPYVNRPSDELYAALREVSMDACKTALLLHCTLDIGYTLGDFGEEKAIRYFPVSSAILSSLGFDYILAGHLHKQTQIRDLEPGTFVYPGSPVSHNTGEIGKRQAVLIDTKKDTAQSLPLPTFYHDKLEMVVDPGREDVALQEAKKWVGCRSKDDCSLEVVVKGHIEVDENEFGRSLDSLDEHLNVTKRYRNVKRLLDYPLFQRFQDKLQEKEDSEDTKEVEKLTIDVMSRLLAGGELGL